MRQWTISYHYSMLGEEGLKIFKTACNLGNAKDFSRCSSVSSDHCKTRRSINEIAGDIGSTRNFGGREIYLSTKPKQRIEFVTVAKKSVDRKWVSSTFSAASLVFLFSFEL
jgi:hypothetical protein